MKTVIICISLFISTFPITETDRLFLENGSAISWGSTCSIGGVKFTAKHNLEHHPENEEFQYYYPDYDLASDKFVSIKEINSDVNGRAAVVSGYPARSETLVSIVGEVLYKHGRMHYILLDDKEGVAHGFSGGCVLVNGVSAGIVVGAFTTKEEKINKYAVVFLFDYDQL